MAWRPHPTTYTCPVCGWSKTVAPESDHLAPGLDVFTVCPKCGHDWLDSRKANAVELLLLKLKGQLFGPWPPRI